MTVITEGNAVIDVQPVSGRPGCVSMTMSQEGFQSRIVRVITPSEARQLANMLSKIADLDGTNLQQAAREHMTREAAQKLCDSEAQKGKTVLDETAGMDDAP